MTGSKSSMGHDQDREFESQGKNKTSGMGGKGHQSDKSGGYGKDTGPQGNMEDDEMNTAGGREGQFSDSNRGKEAQWSPSSDRSPDE